MFPLRTGSLAEWYVLRTSEPGATMQGFACGKSPCEPRLSHSKSSRAYSFRYTGSCQQVTRTEIRDRNQFVYSDNCRDELLSAGDAPRRRGGGMLPQELGGGSS